MSHDMTKASTTNWGWRVTFAGMGINLALGVLYTWSVISKGIPDSWGWNETSKSLPYSIACLVFSIVMVPAGRLQDKIGPRIAASIGGLLVGVGMIFTSRMTTPVMYVVGFGLLAGAGIGFGYAAATPPAIKWFSAAKTGLITGIVVSGFGLASVYISPLTNWLIGISGVQTTLLILGVAFLVVVIVLAQILQPPPAGYVPAGSVPGNPSSPVVKKDDFRPQEMLGTWKFYVLWFMYVCGAGAGLMVIAKLAAIVKEQAGINLGFVLVAVLAIGNGAGRIMAGLVSDKLGRLRTMLICFLLQAILIFLLSRANTGSVLASIPVLALISALIGANYGANLSLFPSITKDYYGLKNFGMNYGLIFTAWGMGGFMLSLLAGNLYDKYHTFAYAYYGASTLLIIAAVLTFVVKTPRSKAEPLPLATGAG